MPKETPLLLRRRRDGSLHILSAEWPPTHEFSWKWLGENANAVTRTDAGDFVLHLANGRAVYREAPILRQSDEGTPIYAVLDDERPSRGVWAVLVEGTVN